MKKNKIMLFKWLIKIYFNNTFLLKLLFSVKFYNFFFRFFNEHDEKILKFIYIILTRFFDSFFVFCQVSNGSIEFLRRYFRKKIINYLYETIDLCPISHFPRQLKYLYLMNRVYSRKNKNKISNLYFNFIVFSTKIITFNEKIKTNLYFNCEIIKKLKHQKNNINIFKNQTKINLTTHKNLLLWSNALKLFILENKFKNIF
jgi:hypothetical protein